MPSKVTRPVPECTDIGTDIDSADLAETASKGEWGELSDHLTALRTKLDGLNCLSSSDERMIVVFPGKDGLGDRILYSIVFPSQGPFSDVLPGLTGVDAKVPQLYEVFIADRPRASLLSSYVATKQDNPATTQAIAALSANFGTLLTLAGGITGAPIKSLMTLNVNSVNALNTEMAKSPPPPKSFASVSHVSLSAARAKVEVARRASIPPTRTEIVRTRRRQHGGPRWSRQSIAVRSWPLPPRAAFPDRRCNCDTSRWCRQRRPDRRWVPSKVGRRRVGGVLETLTPTSVE